MMKAFILTLVYMMSTTSITWGCVTGSGPSWEISQSGRGRPSSGRFIPELEGGGRPGDPNTPSLPTEVVEYFAGNLSKEEAFAGIDIDGDGRVSFDEWTLGGGAMMEFDLLLRRLDTNGDNQISLDELQPYSLPVTTESNIRPRLMDFRGVPDQLDIEETTPHPTNTTTSRPRPCRRRNGSRRPNSRRNRPCGRRSRPRAL